MLRLHPHARAGPRPEGILKAAQAEETRLGTAGRTEQLKGEPPTIVTALHLLAVPGGLVVVVVGGEGEGGGGARAKGCRTLTIRLVPGGTNTYDIIGKTVL